MSRFFDMCPPKNLTGVKTHHKDTNKRTRIKYRVFTTKARRHEEFKFPKKLIMLIFKINLLFLVNSVNFVVKLNQHKGIYFFLFKPQSTQRETIYFLKLCELCGKFLCVKIVCSLYRKYF